MKLFSLLLLFSVVVAGAEPNPPPDVVFKPTFLTGDDSLTGGTGFVAKLDNDYVFLTAFHLFGPATGLEKDLTPAEAKEFAAALAASSMDRRGFVLTSSEMLFIPSAKGFDERDSGHDVAAFLLRGYQGSALKVSATAPKKGEKVYLWVRLRGETKLKMVKAVVSRVSNAALEYVYQDADLNLAGSSGAPVLTEAGEVVGINVAGGEEGGKMFGVANPAGSFVPLVSSAIKAAAGPQ